MIYVNLRIHLDRVASKKKENTLNLGETFKAIESAANALGERTDEQEKATAKKSKDST